MAFTTDGGGVAFKCEDSKISLGKGTWSTRLSQIGRQGTIHIMTRNLVEPDYIARIFEKRPENIFVLAHTTAREEAYTLKGWFPHIEFKLHPDSNSKLVLIGPETVWMATNDFGLAPRGQLDSAIGLHSPDTYQLAFTKFFVPAWNSPEAISV